MHRVTDSTGALVHYVTASSGALGHWVAGSLEVASATVTHCRAICVSTEGYNSRCAYFAMHVVSFTYTSQATK